MNIKKTMRALPPKAEDMQMSLKWWNKFSRRQTSQFQIVEKTLRLKSIPSRMIKVRKRFLRRVVKLYRQETSRERQRLKVLRGWRNLRKKWERNPSQRLIAVKNIHKISLINWTLATISNLQIFNEQKLLFSTQLW